MGKGSGDRANLVAFRRGAETTGFPPESPTFRKSVVDKRVWLSNCCKAPASYGLDTSHNPVIGRCEACGEGATFTEETQ